MATAFATTQDVVNCYDWHRVGELLLDDRTEPPDVNSVITSTLLVELLLQACGEIVSACRVGQRYRMSDLNDLVAANDASAALLRRLTCDLAIELLCSRRMLSADETSVYCPRAIRAAGMLEQLRHGERILDDAHDQAAQAGVQVTAVNQKTVARCPQLLSASVGYFGRSALPPNGPGGCCSHC